MQDFTMKPLGVGGIIDRAIRIYRNNFKHFILFSLLIGGGANLIAALLRPGALSVTRDFAGNTILQYTQRFLEISYTTTGSLASTISAILIGVFITPVVSGGIIWITLRVSHNEDKSSPFDFIKNHYGKLIGTSFAVGIITFAFSIGMVLITFLFALTGALGFLGVFMGIIIIALLLILVPLASLAFPVAIQEDRWGFRWLGRTFQLYFKKFWKSLGTLFLTALIVSLISSVINGLLGLLPPLFSTITTTAVTALLAPVQYIVATLLYLDIRMRVEGYDLELRMSQEQPSTEGQEDFFE